MIHLRPDLGLPLGRGHIRPLLRLLALAPLPRLPVRLQLLEALDKVGAPGGPAAQELGGAAADLEVLGFLSLPLRPGQQRRLPAALGALLPALGLSTPLVWENGD